MKRGLSFLFLVCAIVVSVSAQSGKYTFVFLNNKTDKAKLPDEEVKKIMDGHMANINRLAKEGKLLAAGPFDGGGGIFIFNTTSREQVSDWLSTDPGVQAKRWNIEILSYTPRIGSVCTVSEPYEMVTYNFIRYNTNIMKYNIGSLPDILKKHAAYMKELSQTGNVITEAIFDEQGGSILIMKGDVQVEVIENDPSVKEGLLEFEIKKLWIAKGAFCEK